MYRPSLKTHELFEESANAQVIEYNAGHRFPRQLSDEAFTKLKQFVQTQFMAKNGNDDDFDVEYTEFNFQVRIV